MKTFLIAAMWFFSLLAATAASSPLLGHQSTRGEIQERAQQDNESDSTLANHKGGGSAGHGSGHPAVGGGSSGNVGTVAGAGGGSSGQIGIGMMPKVPMMAISGGAIVSIGGMYWW